MIAALYNKRVSGITIWLMHDFKANDIDTVKCGQCEYEKGVYPPVCRYIDVNCTRPGGENNKGVVDFWRRKKESFYVV